MPTQTLLLLVEGPHDQAFCARLLKLKGFSTIQRFDVLQRDHAYWQRLVPTQWPQGGDLLARHSVPLFLTDKAGNSVAIASADGISNIVTRLQFSLDNLEAPPSAVGVILDADDTSDPSKRREQFCSSSQIKLQNLQWSQTLGEVHPGPPRTGIFVMPDNQSKGTLENLLLDAAGQVYPQLLQNAQNFISATQRDTSLNGQDLGEFNKPAGLNKATVAAMAGILKPGKSIQVSIQDNRWLEATSLNLQGIKAFGDFLDALLA